MQHRTEGKFVYPLIMRSQVEILISTKGGAGGTTTTVSTLPQLSAAASAAGACVVVVQGAISGAAKVSVTSDKTIVGKAGSCESSYLRSYLYVSGNTDTFELSPALALPSSVKRT